MAELTPQLLEEQYVLDAMTACNAAVSIVKHQLDSYEQLITKQVPQIIMETPEIVAHSKSSIHVMRYIHVQVDRPVAKTDGGFFDVISEEEAKNARQTLANPVIVDVEYSVYSNAETSKEVVWETISAEESDRQIQIAERRRRGLPVDDLLPKVVAQAQPPSSSDAGGSGGDPAAPGDKPRPARRTTKKVSANSISVTSSDAPGEQNVFTLREKRVFKEIFQFQLPTVVNGIGSRPDGLASLAPNARYDPGGYFIVKGSEKVVMPQKHLHVNRYFVFPSAKGNWAWSGEIRACHSGKYRSTSTMRVSVKCGKGGSGPLRSGIRMPYIDMDIPVLAVCMLLGFKNVEEVATSVATGGRVSGHTDIPKGSLWDAPSVLTTRLWVLSLLRDDADNYPAFETMSRTRILQWIGEQGTKRKTASDRAKYVAHLMANEFLPQMGLDSSPLTIARKAQYFAFMLWRMSQVARGYQEPDDRDHAGNKQYDLCGMLLALLLRQHYRNFRKRVAGDIRRYAEQGRFVGVPELLSIKRMTDGFTYALSTGNWGMKKGGSTQTGVAQMLSRGMNMISTFSHLRRLNTPLKREGKQARPRQLHTTLWGLECPAETPEGPPCGLVAQMAQCGLFCHGHSADKLVRQTAGLLGDLLVPLLDPSILTGAVALLPTRPSYLSNASHSMTIAVLEHEAGAWDAVQLDQARTDAVMFGADMGASVRVMVNGILIGFARDGRAAAAALRVGRRNRRLPYDVAVELMEMQGMLAVSGEAGGRRRALFILDPVRRLDKVREVWQQCRRLQPEHFWWQLRLQGCVEYVSKHEEENLMVLVSPTGGYQSHAPIGEYTHCEIHPSAILGISAAAIPESDHNQAPRTTYSSGMRKQAAGNPGPETPSTNALRLMYPQKPLVTTWAQVMYGMFDMPDSQNVFVAVLSDNGQNQEDSLYLNEDSANRGLFACSMIKNHMEDCQSGSGADSQRFEKPSQFCHGRKMGNYDKLRDDGFLAPGTHVEGGDVYCGKTMSVNEMGCVRRTTITRDQSSLLHPREKPMLVDSVKRCRGRDDKDIATIQMHTTRFMQVGDKLTSIHGQKGIVGHMKPARDMPFTASGIVADLIINPHAYPSRMTIGQCLEAARGLVCATTGETGDGTPFRKPTERKELVDELRADLLAHGFEFLGDQVMYKGETGQRMQGLVFFGPVMYFRTKQMVDDKHHARARGPVHGLTNQPNEGRSKDGGLRIGEMERDCIQSHGAAWVAMDRLFYSSDYAEIPVCRECHLIALPRAPVEKRGQVINFNEKTGYCMNCKKAGTVYMTPMPYITKLLSLELMAMHVRPEIVIDVDPNVDANTMASVGIPRAANAPLATKPRVLKSCLKRPRDAAHHHQQQEKRQRGGGANPWQLQLPEL